MDALIGETVLLRSSRHWYQTVLVPIPGESAHAADVAYGAYAEKFAPSLLKRQEVAPEANSARVTFEKAVVAAPPLIEMKRLAGGVKSVSCMPE